MSRWWPPVRDWANRQLFSGGQRVAPHLPTPLVRRAARAGAALATRLDRSHVQTYRTNLHGLLGEPPSDELVRAGLASWLRTYVEVLALGRWSRERIVAQVRCIGEERLRAAYADTGAVVALPHSANWDLAGAWACSTGLPVTTVAENLGAAEFAAFTRMRSHLGMEVLAHDDPTALRHLVRAAADGRVVCLLSERVFDNPGVEVRLAGQTIRMPAGPAMVARRSGAALIAGVPHYTETGMVIVLSEIIEPQPGRDGLTAMTQQVADFFTGRLRAHPQDWHMLQPLLEAP